jgi:hypothetical protein
MSHWSELDNNNIVTRVVVGNNNDPDEGYQWIMDNLGGTWVKTSYNGNIRKNFGRVGYTYDTTRDAFIPPKQYESWVLNEQTCIWEAPTPCPENGNYFWSEDEIAWIPISDPV